ncbi:MAG TPA: hypothetical protein VK966_02490, partial [Longimicrobiales bacterium]|nr:hypothetical protein [Longimicrobiales bacterium]
MSKMLKRVAALGLPLLLAVPAPMAAQSFAGAPAPAMAGFGGAVAVGDGVVFVGEPANRMRPGLVYVYMPRGGEWVEAGQISAPDAANGDGFGRALAVTGDMLLVSQVRGDGPDVVHVFRGGGDEWSHQTTLEAQVDPEASFGAALAAGDGLLAVGAPAADGSGQVFVYRMTAGGWDAAGSFGAADGSDGDGLGSAVAVDGDRILAGAAGRNDRAGGAYVFRQDPGTGEWTQEAALVVSGLEQRNGFGSAVALAGNRALVGAPGFDQGTGVVVEFQRDAIGGEWEQARRLLPFDASQYNRFGTAVALEDGDAFIG